MSTHDQNFANLFMVVIGILIAITFVLIGLARFVGNSTQLQWAKQDPETLAAVASRIAPAGQVATPGSEPAGETPPAGAAEAAAAPVATKMTGEQVYNAACFACHGAGVGGAPKFGDAGQWAPRIAKGKATLKKHSIEGFQGDAGFMPPKGGRVDLSDEEIMDAVEFMISQSS
jgi:cytochrome c5